MEDSRNGYEKFTDDELADKLRNRTKTVADLEGTLEFWRMMKAEVEAEIDRRTLLTLPIGTKVCDVQYGNGEIVRIEEGLTFCVVALFASGEKRFTVQGAAQMRFMYEQEGT